MGRNKYPEVTVEKILDVCQRLFLEKGYDNTTIQDIVDELGGLTKGAVYHHFKSKEEIMDAIGDRMFFQNNPFEKVKKRKDLNGLQKIKEVIMLHQGDEQSVELTKQSGNSAASYRSDHFRRGLSPDAVLPQRESASRPARHYAFRHYPCRPLRAAYLLPLRQESSPSLPLRRIRYRLRHTPYTCF